MNEPHKEIERLQAEVLKHQERIVDLKEQQAKEAEEVAQKKRAEADEAKKGI